MDYYELISKGKNASKNKNMSEALTFYLEALKLQVSEELLIEIALLYDELHDYDKAKDYYLMVIELNDSSPIPYYGLGTIFDTLLKYDEAIAYYKEAIRLKETYYPAHFFLANIYDMRKEVHLAIYHYKRVIEINPNYFYAYLNLSAIYESLDQDEEALELLLKGENIDSANHLLHFNLGVVYRKLDHIDLSITHYLKSLSISKKHPYTFLNLAIIFKDDKNDLTKAIEVYSDGIVKHPSEAVLYYNRACAYALLNQFPNTLSDLEKAIILDPSIKEFMLTDDELNDFKKSEFYIIELKS